jgi:hypothetical protein
VGADKRVNPIELFRGQLSERNDTLAQSFTGILLQIEAAEAVIWRDCLPLRSAAVILINVVQTGCYRSVLK